MAYVPLRLNISLSTYIRQGDKHDLESLNPLFDTNPGDVTNQVCAVLEFLSWIDAGEKQSEQHRFGLYLIHQWLSDTLMFTSQYPKLKYVAAIDKRPHYASQGGAQCDDKAFILNPEAEETDLIEAISDRLEQTHAIAVVLPQDTAKGAWAQDVSNPALAAIYHRIEETQALFAALTERGRMSEDTPDQAIDRHKAYMKLAILYQCITGASVAVTTYQAQQMGLFHVLDPDSMVDGLMRNLVAIASKAVEAHDEVSDILILALCTLIKEEQCTVRG